MAYRPQFAYPPAPPGFRDEPYEYFFDGTNTPGLQFNLLTPQPILDIPLTTESDSEFHIRGLQIGTFEDLGPLGVQLKDAAGNLLSTDFVPMQFFTGFLLPAFEGGEATPVESEIVVPPAGIPRISLLNLAAGPWSQMLPNSLMLPVISTTNLGAFKAQAESVGGTAVNPIPFYYAGNLYMFVQLTTNAGNPGGFKLGVYQWNPSTQTWVQLDAAHAPAAGSGNGTTAGVLFDGAHTLTVAYNPTNVVAGLGALTLRDFDLSQGLWVAAGNYPVGPNVYQVNQLFRRSDGTIVVIDGGVAGHTGLNARILTAGAWTTVALDTNLVGQTSNGGSAAVYDPATGGIHIFGLTNSGGGNNGFYQFFSLANALGTFVAFTPANFFINGWAMGNPVIVGNSIYFGVIDPGATFASLLVGTPLTGPVFSAVTVNIDPGAPSSAGGGNRQPSLAYDATTGLMYATWSPDLQALRFSWAKAPFTNWTGVELAPQYSFASADGTLYQGLQYPVVGVSSIGVPYIAFEARPELAGQPSEVILRILTQISLPVTLRGVKRFKAQVCALPGVGK